MRFLFVSDRSGATLDNVISEKYEFSNSEEVGNGVRHSGVGSGVPFKLFPQAETSFCLYTTASITCQTGWGVSEDRVLSPPDYFFNKINVNRRLLISILEILQQRFVISMIFDFPLDKHWMKIGNYNRM